ncbi:hydroxymethylpyrimidine/phosphomethylpyrimidine kinase [Chitinophaga nivalis]|uniref:hydroxymethylpyrimidine kinase n=1 Tax=Chitinophaga nivalis TaxID=2991709 RepID=A0ABT3IV09_9BACT|nr:hydroxymethylpyrimidine/phosphomethylpyrimidine kinase [Chitinophaga nivalis]MCW3462531.1 hydroxymethylpyrimidine/phosphomethylpyrimidine kinase [Chitinophaga nivalis]MCW3487778.1 hydroxymethylpyrimidine/phosphomethylpyrimidine kinase [Chitinophaga nivalis]
MEQERPYVMSFAGLDPSGGAGLLADIKTFEQHRVNGLGICTAITVQTADRFLSVEWLPTAQILAQATPLLNSCTVPYCKIGIMEDVSALQTVVRELKQLVPDIRIILDPVLKASAGFTFHDSIRQQAWKELLADIYLLTPNYDEALALAGHTDGEAAAKILSDSCAVLLKGGHHRQRPGYDTLFTGATTHVIPPGHAQVFPKHGSGCVLSAAVTAGLAKGLSLPDACHHAKAYTEKLLGSNPSLTGYHYL